MKERPPSEDTFDMSPADVAALTGFSDDIVKRWADGGDLRCVRTPGGHRRFRRSDVDAFLEARAKAGAA